MSQTHDPPVVLLALQDEKLRKSLQTYFDARNFQALTSATVPELVETAGSKRPAVEVIVMSLEIGGQSAEEVLTVLKQGAGRRPPVVIYADQIVEKSREGDLKGRGAKEVVAIEFTGPESLVQVVERNLLSRDPS